MRHDDVENEIENKIFFSTAHYRVEEVVRRHKGPSPKSLDLDENSKPYQTQFCRDIKICRDLRTF